MSKSFVPTFRIFSTFTIDVFQRLNTKEMPPYIKLSDQKTDFLDLRNSQKYQGCLQDTIVALIALILRSTLKRTDLNKRKWPEQTNFFLSFLQQLPALANSKIFFCNLTNVLERNHMSQKSRSLPMPSHYFSWQTSIQFNASCWPGCKSAKKGSIQNKTTCTWTQISSRPSIGLNSS